MLNALIIDDEVDACKNVEYLLQKYFQNQIQVLPAAHSTSAAEEIMAKNKIHLYFVDIEMPIESGIAFVARNASTIKNVVFVTAFDQYAIAAFKLHAIDYILKPIDEEAFVLSMQHILQNNFSRTTAEYEQLANKLNSKEAIDVMVLRDKQELTRINISDIIYLEAEKAYCKIVYRWQKETKIFFASHNLAFYEDLLENHLFIRVHKSFLVNKSMITKFNFKESNVVLFHTFQVPVSRRKQAGLLKII